MILNRRTLGVSYFYHFFHFFFLLVILFYFVLLFVRWHLLLILISLVCGNVFIYNVPE